MTNVTLSNNLALIHLCGIIGRDSISTVRPFRMGCKAPDPDRSGSDP
jgi:hypothetical protein